jgi:hypothetical protein
MPLVRGLETVRFGVEPAPLPLSPQREHTDGSAPHAREGEHRSWCQTNAFAPVDETGCDSIVAQDARGSSVSVV